ncbi:bestrophin-1-like [Acyrthosiphon pisum]|uniref:Bestrophin homolog n=1 Tax=Acyrthosiphon pisum TaxID=7029 RepID=A0A8R2NKI7_ACYPI|nr:bestrophin-1-like [Acyrthosiphon pisum]
MTITYTDQVATCRGLGCFWKLLFRFSWKGSIYKLLWPNLILFTICYFSLSLTYRIILTQSQRDLFEKISLHCQMYTNLIPVSFVLGFYVAVVVGRWWNQYLSIPWPDSLALYVSTLIIGQNERSRLIRRTIMRYANLCILMTLTMICPAVKKRFPTMDHLVESGFLMTDEKALLESMDSKTSHPNYWMPLVWAATIVTQAKKEGRITNEFSIKTLVDEINKIRSNCGSLLSYDWISVPLVYTQVTTLAVYVYFAASLMGNQYLDPRKGYPTHPIDLVVPIFTFLQFFFYMGWLMVAETLVNPFGEDDDDFDVNWLIDRNLQVSYIIVDEMHQEYPEMVKDQYWNEIFPSELPYTEETKHLQITPFLGSAQAIEARTEYNDKKPTVTSYDEKMVTVQEIKDKPKIKTEFSNNVMTSLMKEYHKNVHDDFYNNFSGKEKINQEQRANYFGESLISLTDYSRSQLLPSTSTQTQYVSKSTPYSVVSSCSDDESDQEHQI